MVVVRNAGHMVPYDQPERAYDLIRRVSGVHRGGFKDLRPNQDLRPLQLDPIKNL